MHNYKISDECRRYLDAILLTFDYNRIADIRGSVEKVSITENSGKSQSEIYNLKLEIEQFLETNNFGHSADYIFIIDKKGIDLKEAGNLKNYELNSD